MVPTFLYIKRHIPTGLLYFGKTISKDPVKYAGSGLHWTRHLKKHGRDVETIWFCLFEDQETLSEFALMCSEQWGIVDSKEWANQILENGLDGGCPGTKFTDEHKAKIRASNLGVKRSEETKARISAANLRRGPKPPVTEATKAKLRERWAIRKQGKPNPVNTVEH